MSREIKRGMVFRDTERRKCYVANIFSEGENEVLTYRYWNRYGKCWIFKTQWKQNFLIGFEYSWKWEDKHLLK